MSEMSNIELERLIRGGEAALAELYLECRPRLERMVAFRLDPRLRGRVDPADILQEAFLAISKRLPEFLDAPDVSSFVWLRRITLQTLVDTHRRHFRDKRSVGKEVKLRSSSANDATSYSIAFSLLDHQASPSKAAVEAEEIDQLRQALESMDEIDREVLALRHFEHLTNHETAEALGLSITAASNRYVRAMGRLAELMKSL
jgi:RNA polymerase sigma-70 factor (ECF subfamily)